jgi:hypothetical protein
MAKNGKSKKSEKKHSKVNCNNQNAGSNVEDNSAFSSVTPKEIGILDMVIAFDTTGSMAEYIGAVRKEVSELVPRLFKYNQNLRLGIVAFGDYCDMTNATEFGIAYQYQIPTANANDIIKFINQSKDTNGGDSDEFYELVIRKIVEETPWRENSTKVILLIADAAPHPLGYTYQDYVVRNQIDWRIEARNAKQKGIKIDTVSIRDEPWYKELSEITNGVSVPFKTGEKTACLVEAATMARGSKEARMHFFDMAGSCVDDFDGIFDSYSEVIKEY